MTVGPVEPKVAAVADNPAAAPAEAPGGPETPTATDGVDPSATVAVRDRAAAAISGEPTHTGAAPLPPGEATKSTGSGKPDESDDPSKWGMMLDVIQGAGESPWTHAVVALPAALPGLGQVVSGCMAGVMLTGFIIDAVKNKHFNWFLLAGAVMYTIGIFLPGFGGVMAAFNIALAAEYRMNHAPKEPPKEDDAARSAEGSAVHRELGAHLREGTIHTWLRKLAELDAERKRLLQDNSKAAERQALDRELGVAVPSEVARYAERLAYGQAALAEEITAGSLYQLALATDWSTHYAQVAAAVPGMTPGMTEATFMQAVRAYNGFEPSEMKAGEVVYIPTIEQLAYFQEHEGALLPAIPGALEHHGLSQIREALLELGDDTPEMQRALRLLKVVSGMLPYAEDLLVQQRQADQDRAITAVSGAAPIPDGAAS